MVVESQERKRRNRFRPSPQILMNDCAAFGKRSHLRFHVLPRDPTVSPAVRRCEACLLIVVVFAIYYGCLAMCDLESSFKFRRERAPPCDRVRPHIAIRNPLLVL